MLTDRRDVLVAQRTSAINRLRWLVHELDPERAPAARSLDAAKHQQGPADLAGHPARIGRRTRARRADRHHPAHRRDQHPGPAHQRPESTRSPPALLEIPGCAELTAAKIVRRSRRSDPVQKRSRLRLPCRSGSHPGVVGQHRRPDAAQPLGQPPAQRRPTPHRTDPNPDDRQPGPGLLPKAARRRENQTRSTTLPQTPPSPHRLPGPAHRPPLAIGAIARHTSASHLV